MNTMPQPLYPQERATVPSTAASVIGCKPAYWGPIMGLSVVRSRKLLISRELTQLTHLPKKLEIIHSVDTVPVKRLRSEELSCMY